MGRTAEGWKLVWRRGIGCVRFRHKGKRHEISTLQREPVAATEVAARIYADFVSGRVKRATTGALIHPATPIDELCANWIADIMPELGDGTDSTYETYARHWTKHFKTIGEVGTASIGDYQRKRLGEVQRSTIIKERSGLLRFLEWLVEKEMLSEVPPFPKLAKKATGTRHKQARLAPQVELSPEEIELVLAALPELSLRSRNGRRFPVKARFEFAYETGLRPETLDKVLARDITVSGLHMRAELDKNRWERVIPLSNRARAAVKSLGTRMPADPLFGAHDYRAVFRKACVQALGEERGSLVTPYDLKHARVTHLFEDGASIPGIKFLTGTDVALDRYIRPSRRAAEAAIGGHSGDGPRKLAGPSSEKIKKPRCEGEDLNLHGSYPASTSS